MHFSYLTNKTAQVMMSTPPKIKKEFNKNSTKSKKKIKKEVKKRKEKDVRWVDNMTWANKTIHVRIFFLLVETVDKNMSKGSSKCYSQ